MKKTLAIFSLLFAFMILAAPQALALEIHVDHNGTVRFFQDGVLGETDEENDAPEEKEDEQENEHEEENDDDREESKSGPSTDAVKTVRPEEKKEIKIRTEGKNASIQVQTKSERRSNTEEIKHSENLESRRVKMQFPAKLKEQQSEQREKRETKTEKRIDEFTEKQFELNRNRDEYLEALKEDRKKRQEEMIELRTQLKNDAQELELKSRGIKAHVKQGAQFSLDPNTNEVSIVTPSGNEHTLNHLPDQAIERMKAAGILTDAGNGETEIEVEIETTDDGQVLYKKKDQVRKRVFGVFSRKINREITVNDTSGEVTEAEVKSPSLMGQFLDSVSF